MTGPDTNLGPGVAVPPTCCPDGHDYNEPGWSVSPVWCTCNDRPGPNTKVGPVQSADHA
jgi:hypothetical protein